MRRTPPKGSLNNMFPASSKKGGIAFAAPDVCKTPPLAVPVPYPNQGQVASSVSVATKVLAENKELVTEASQIPSTSLDEGGSMTGVKSSTVKGPVTFKTYSSKVFAQGKKVVYHTSVTGQNGTNANIIGMQVSPSQTLVIVAP